MVHEENDIILVADEAPWVRELLGWLEKHRYFATLSLSDCALGALRQTRPAFALIQATLPGAWLLMNRVRAEKALKKTRLLAILPAEAVGDARKAVDSQVDYLLFHPLSEHAVIHALRNFSAQPEEKTVPLSLFESTLELIRKQTAAAPQPRPQQPPALNQKSITANLRRLNSELERRLLACQAELSAAEKDLDSFAYSVSHDLRAPLRAIEGFSKIVMEDFSQALDPEAQKLLGFVEGNSRQMMLLIDDIVSFYRATRGKLAKSPQDVNQVVKTVWEDLCTKTDRKVQLKVSHLPPAFADPKALNQTFTHLLANAIKFSGKSDAPVIEVGAHDLKGEQVYYVKDNGVGFDMQYAHRLFRLFQRLHPAADFQGNGMGLALVQRLVARHGGRVWAEAIPEVGATFNFSLPAQDIKPAQP